MRLHPDDKLQSLDIEDLLNILCRHKDFDEKHYKNKTKENLIHIIKQYQRTRYLMLWHDGSSVANHSHLMMMVSCIYDTCSFLTDEEYQKTFGRNVNIQSIVEKAFMYILARCPSKDQQLLYIEERLNDIKELSSPLEIDNIPIFDIMRVFKGDNPASQFEVGHQKNGDYFCWQCPLNAQLLPNIVHSLSLLVLSLQDRINIVRATSISKNKINRKEVNLYKNLKKHELVQELHERNISFTCTSNQKELQDLLNKQMHDIKRLPSLLYNNPNADLKELNLEQYEILNNEPLHDISHHTQNLYEEIPLHLPKHHKESLKEIIKKSFNEKEAKNSSDYRDSLITVCIWLIKHHPDSFVTKIFTMHAEIQEILYAGESRQNIVTILHLINVCFIHLMLLKIHIQGNLKC